MALINFLRRNLFFEVVFFTCFYCTDLYAWHSPHRNWSLIAKNDVSRTYYSLNLGVSKKYDFVCSDMTLDLSKDRNWKCSAWSSFLLITILSPAFFTTDHIINKFSGSLVSIIPGFGLGHLYVGRWQETGWKFTLFEVGAIGYALFLVEDGLGVIALLLMSRIAAIVDILSYSKPSHSPISLQMISQDNGATYAFIYSIRL